MIGEEITIEIKGKTPESPHKVDKIHYQQERG